MGGHMDVDDIFNSVEKQFQKDVRDIKRSLIIDNSYRSTTIFIVAISDGRNQSMFIPCEGTALTHDVYDSVRDGFVFYGVEYYTIGNIPVSYRLEFEDCEWQIEIPLPMSVVRRYMSDEEKRNFSLWKSKFDKEEFRFMSLQMLDSY